MEETSMKYDKIFALRLLPAMKEFSILNNMNFRVGVQETLRRNFPHLETPELWLITYQNMSLASSLTLSHCN
jgi:hypothetical protein